MDSNTLEIIAIVLGNGALTAIIVAILGYAFQRQQHISEKDFEARKEARDYYKTIYGHIAVIDEITKSYLRSAEESQGKTDVFCFENGNIEVQTTARILESFKEAYMKFSTYYLKSSSLGYEIFISKQLRDLLSEFWKMSMIFYNHPELLANKIEVRKFNIKAEQTTDCMERLFGLHENWRYSARIKLNKTIKRIRGENYV